MTIKDLGLIDYQKVWDIQKECVDHVIADPEKIFLLLCEHPTVLTLGRLADQAHVLESESMLAQKGISMVSVDRGGQVTLHAPGQLIMYPIFNLERTGKDLHAYLHQLEQVGIDFLQLFDIMGDRISTKTGVWIGDSKIASIGIGVRKWVSYHGISMNININLDSYDMINPCGMKVDMTSLEKEKGFMIDMNDAREKFVGVFQQIFKL